MVTFKRLFLLLFISSLSFSHLYLDAKSLDVVRQEYAEQYRLEGAEFIGDFFELTNIDESQWDEHKKALRNVYLREEKQLVDYFQQPGSLDQDLVKNTKDLMKEYGFEKGGMLHDALKYLGLGGDRMQIINASGAYHSPAFCTENYVYLDAEMLNGLSSEQIASIVMHELGHVKFGHTYNKYCMGKLLEQRMGNMSDQDINQANQFFSHYSKFCERQADAYSSLADPKYARALGSVFQGWAQSYGDQESDTHPKHSERVDAAQGVLKQLGLGTTACC